MRNILTRHTYYFTFGQQYAREDHPQLPFAHPDGWVEIGAESYMQARIMMWLMAGGAWSGQYSDDTFEEDKHFYPKGCLLRVEVPASTVLEPLWVVP